MLHSKVMVVDREWTLVGSCNLDPRSMWINLELLAVIRSRPFADEILRLCSAELRRSQRIRLIDHARLTWRQRLLHRLAWGLRWWL
jgi:cardiolipin synthase